MLGLELKRLDDVRGWRRRGASLLVPRLLERQVTSELGSVRRRADRGVHPERIALARGVGPVLVDALLLLEFLDAGIQDADLVDELCDLLLVLLALVDRQLLVTGDHDLIDLVWRASGRLLLQEVGVACARFESRLSWS